jgi:hypothetical protein
MQQRCGCGRSLLFANDAALAERHKSDAAAFGGRYFARSPGNLNGFSVGIHARLYSPRHAIDIARGKEAMKLRELILITAPGSSIRRLRLRHGEG